MGRARVIHVVGALLPADQALSKFAPAPALPPRVLSARPAGFARQACRWRCRLAAEAGWWTNNAGTRKRVAASARARFMPIRVELSNISFRTYQCPPIIQSRTRPFITEGQSGLFIAVISKNACLPNLHQEKVGLVLSLSLYHLFERGNLPEEVFLGLSRASQHGRACSRIRNDAGLRSGCPPHLLQFADARPSPPARRRGRDPRARCEPKSRPARR